jgi:hypothetical protein
MAHFHGTEIVDPGIYFNFAELEFHSVEEPQALPGPADGVWRRVPLIALFAGAPLIGLAYLVFLPLVGFAMLAAAAVRPLAGWVAEAAAAGARVLRPAWQPARAFLGRGKPARLAAADEWAEATRSELEEGPAAAAEPPAEPE